MANIVEFIYKLQDQVSGTLTKVASTATKVATNMQQVKRANDEVSISNREVANSTNVANSGFNNLIKMAAGYVGVMQSIRGIKAFVGLGMDMEQIKVKFETLLDSSAKANNLINDINKFADLTPFENIDLVKASETMLAFGINGNKIMPTLRMLGDVSLGNKDKLEALSLAYSQVSSTGRLTGQDLLQMVNVGFNPLLIMSEKTGKSMSELKDIMEDGGISFKMVEDAFISATSEGGRFYDMMNEMSKTSEGKLSTIIGNLRAKLMEYSEKLKPYINKFMDYGIIIVNQFDKIVKAIWNILIPVRLIIAGLYQLFLYFKNNAMALSILITLVSLYKLLMLQASYAIKGWTIVSMVQYGWLLLVEKAQALLNATVMKNPLIALVTAISMVVGAFVLMRQKTKEAGNEVFDLNKKAAEYGRDERARLDQIFDKLRKTNPKSDERNKLAKQLNEMYPNTLKNINLETASLDELNKVYNTLIETIKRKSMAQAAQDRMTELYKKLDDSRAAEEDILASDDFKLAELSRSNKYYDYLVQIDNLRANKKRTQSEIDKLANRYGSDIANYSSELGGEFTNQENPAIDPADKVSSLTGGGSKATNITINLRNLIENNTINSETLEGGVDGVADKLIESLLRVVNSANRLAVN